MSAVMEILLADQRRMEALRDVTPSSPPSRADRLIAEGERRRLAYRSLSPNADAGMVYGAQIGYLHAQVRILCAEAEALSITRDADLQYITVDCAALSDVVVGFDYDAGSAPRITSARYFEQTGDPGDPGADEELTLSEAWVNGVELLAVLSESVIEQLEAAALAKIHAQQSKARETDGEYL